MTRMAVQSQSRRHYSVTYTSDAVGPDAEHMRAGVRHADNSVSIGQRQAALFDKIIEARAVAAQDNWDNDGASAVDQQTVDAAIRVLHALPESLPAPEITPETTGEIAFEWYRDRDNVAVVTIHRDQIRWAAVIRNRPSVSGRAPFSRTIPSVAIETVTSVVG